MYKKQKEYVVNFTELLGKELKDLEKDFLLQHLKDSHRNSSVCTGKEQAVSRGKEKAYRKTLRSQGLAYGEMSKKMDSNRGSSRRGLRNFN